MPAMDIISADLLSRWLFEFKLNGFLLFPALFPPGLIDEMNRQFEELLALEIEIERKGLPPSVRGAQRYAVNIGTVIEKSGGPLNDPLARANPMVEELANALLGRWRRDKLIVECPLPGSDYMGWHTDTYYKTPEERDAPKRTTMLKLHIPLVDVDETNGPMEVIPGSHRMNYVEGDAAVRALSRVYSTKILTRKGDAYLRDGDLIHRGTPNLSDKPRPLYSQIYKAAGQRDPELVVSSGHDG